MFGDMPRRASSDEIYQRSRSLSGTSVLRKCSEPVVLVSAASSSSPPYQHMASAPVAPTSGATSGAASGARAPRSLKLSMPRMRQNEAAAQSSEGGGAGGRLLDTDSEQALPPKVKNRLRSLFAQIEKEFEAVYSENLALHRELELIQEKSDLSERFDDADGGAKYKQKLMVQAAQKLNKPTNRLKQQTSRIVSSFKPTAPGCVVAREFRGHKDGVWHVCAGRADTSVICTASADSTARVWSVESGRCLLIYGGHSGSVNSVRCHPTRHLVVSASGDETAHIWQAAVVHDTTGAASSDDETDDNHDQLAGDSAAGCQQSQSSAAAAASAASGGGGGGVMAGGGGASCKELSSVLRTPLLTLSGHSSVVIAADWVAGAEQVVTASWDRTGLVYDAATGECVGTLAGHDRELTHVAAHPSHKFVVTASRDSTFRLWDFRERMPCVSVFQGHTDTVTSAVFAGCEDRLVTASDDRSCKVWDLKNMRQPVATMRGDAAVNRLAVSCCHLVAAPFDNRYIRVYDLSGQRLCRLPRSNRVGHRRMVTAVAWAEETSVSKANLFSAGFDNIAIGWIYSPVKDTY